MPIEAFFVAMMIAAAEHRGVAGKAIAGHDADDGHQP